MKGRGQINVEFLVWKTLILFDQIKISLPSNVFYHQHIICSLFPCAFIIFFHITIVIYKFLPNL